MAPNHKWELGHTFHHVHPMEDLTPGEPPIPRRDHIDDAYESDAGDGEFTDDDDYTGDPDEESTVPSSSVGDGGWGLLPPGPVLPPEYMPMPTPRPASGWSYSGRRRPDEWQRFYLDRGVGRHALTETDLNRDIWIAFLLDGGASRNTSWWRSFELRFARCPAAPPWIIFSSE
uniref:Uncharacterized protein n=1 Tax=Leersia perrieri TaxID=77586 RepID=A0A0D9XL24_9ORYZ